MCQLAVGEMSGSSGDALDNKQNYHAQLGLPDKGLVIKGLVV